MKANDVRIAMRLLDRREAMDESIAQLTAQDSALTIVLSDLESGEELGVIDDGGIVNAARQGLIAKVGELRDAIDAELRALGVTDIDAPSAAASSLFDEEA